MPVSWMSFQAMEADSAPEEGKELAKGEGQLTEVLGVHEVGLEPCLLEQWPNPPCRAVLMRKCPQEAQGLQAALLGTLFGETDPATSTDITSVSETQPCTRRLSRPLSLLANTPPLRAGFLTSCVKSVWRVSLV